MYVIGVIHSIFVTYFGKKNTISKSYSSYMNSNPKRHVDSSVID